MVIKYKTILFSKLIIFTIMKVLNKEWLFLINKMHHDMMGL